MITDISGLVVECCDCKLPVAAPMSIKATYPNLNTFRCNVCLAKYIGEQAKTKTTCIPQWDEYFMKMAELVRTRSKDRSTQVGSVIVSPENTVLSTGYNGFPRGLNDSIESRHSRPAKYMWTEHSERNAIYAAAMQGVKLAGARIYITGGGIACADCARAIIQSGIVEAIGMAGTFEGKGQWAESCQIGEQMLREAKVRVRFLDINYQPLTVLCSRL